MTRIRAALAIALLSLLAIPLSGCGGGDDHAGHPEGDGHDHPKDSK